MKIWIIHGWSGYSDECWFQWLKKQLEERGHEVHVPQMPDADAPDITKWVSKMRDIVEPDDQTILIGHSIGCQTILRYLEGICAKIKAAVFVAGFFNLIENSFEDQEDKDIAKPWLDIRIDADKVKLKAERIVAIFSDNDPHVPLSDAALFKERLGAETIIYPKMGHMGGSDNLTEFPELLNKIMELIL